MKMTEAVLNVPEVHEMITEGTPIRRVGQPRDRDGLVLGLT